jgi:hypothetical protein
VPYKPLCTFKSVPLTLDRSTLSINTVFGINKILPLNLLLRPNTAVVGCMLLVSELQALYRSVEFVRNVCKFCFALRLSWVTGIAQSV